MDNFELTLDTLAESNSDLIVVLGDFFFFNCDSLHARLNRHYEAWSFKKRSRKKIAGYRKSV